MCDYNRNIAEGAKEYQRAYCLTDEQMAETLGVTPERYESVAECCEEWTVGEAARLAATMGCSLHVLAHGATAQAVSAEGVA